MVARAPLFIPAPQAPAAPPGLFDVALGPLPFPEAAAVGNGLLYVPDTCEDDVFVYAMNCPPVSGSKTFSAQESPVSGAPFGVITSYTCSSIGQPPPYTSPFEYAVDKVLTRMRLREQRAVERRLWQGIPAGGIGGIPGIFQSATDLGAASCPTEGVRLLEQALADNGVVGGLIHARTGMSPHFAASHLLVPKAANARTNYTWVGTPVVFGQGYNGTGPAGQATSSTTEYMYASGRVLIWATPEADVPDPRQTMDFASNTIYALAEKVFAVIVECGSWVVQVTRDCTTD